MSWYESKTTLVGVTLVSAACCGLALYLWGKYKPKDGKPPPQRPTPTQEAAWLNQRLVKLQQDLAFSETENLDREKRRRREEEERALEEEKQFFIAREESLRFAQEEAKKAQLKALIDSIEPEPLETDPPGSFFVCVIRLLNGQKQSRRFNVDSTFQALKNYVDARVVEGHEIPTNYIFVVDWATPHLPRQEFKNMELKFSESGLDLFKKVVIRIEVVYDASVPLDGGLRLSDSVDVTL